MRKISLWMLLTLAVALVPGTAAAQSTCQYIATGKVLTAAQWNACFQAKADAAGLPASYLPIAGGSMIGQLVTAPSSVAAAGINLPPGTAPSSPNNGDLWTTSAGLFVQINGGTVGPLGTGGGGGGITALTGDVTASGSGSVAATIAANAVTYAKFVQPTAVSLVGNPTGSGANAQNITLGSTLNFSGTTLNVTTATTSQLGAVEPDGTSIAISGGVISVIGSPASSINASGSGGATSVVGGTNGNCLFITSGLLDNQSCGTATSVAIGVTNVASSTVGDVLVVGASNVLQEVAQLGGAAGGTGVNNGSSTITVGGNFAMSGSFSFTGTITGATTVTFPTSGTLATTSNTVASLGNAAADASLTISGTGAGPYTGTVTAKLNLSNVNIWAAIQSVSIAPTANTSGDGFVLEDLTAATSGNQQFSPRLRLTGQGWKTASVAASQEVDWIVENQPAQGSTAPSTNLVFSAQINGGGYSPEMTLTSGGFLTTASMLLNGVGALEVTGTPTAPTGNGQGSLGATATLGAVIIGQGSAADATIENKSGATVCDVPTGTTQLNCISLAINGTAQTFPGSGLIVGTTDTQTLSGKTLTSPTINGGALSGTLSGAPTLSGAVVFSGVPLLSGLSAGTCSSGLAIDSGHHIITGTCPSGGGSGTVNSGTSGSLAYYASTGTAVSGTGVSYSSNALFATSAGGYYLNSSSNYGISYPGVAPTAGGGNTSLVGFLEGGTNIAGSNPPNIILDASLNNGNYQTGRHFMTLDSDAALQADFFTILSHNDQTQPSSVAQNMGFGGTWNIGDNPEIEIQYTGSGGGTVFIQCLVGSTCNGAWGSGTSTTVIAGYFQNYISVNSPFPGIGLYAAGVSANTPSAGFEGFNMLYSAFYTGTVTMTNLSTTSAGTVSLHGNSSNQLDGPVGLFISRVRPSGSSRSPQALDNIGLISWTAPTTSFPSGGPPGPNGTGGQPYAGITSTIIDPTSYTGDLEFYTACGGAVGTMCLRAVIGGNNASGLVVGAPPSITSSLSHEFEVWATSSHGSEVLSVTGNVEESSSMTILAESQGGSNANVELRASTVFLYGTLNGGACSWNGSGTSLSCSSDARIKKDFEPLLDATEKLALLHPVSFELKHGAGGRHDGFTAQDVQSVMPELVTRSHHETKDTPDGELRLEYTGLIPWTVEAINELSARVGSLEKPRRLDKEPPRANHGRPSVDALKHESRSDDDDTMHASVGVHARHSLRGQRYRLLQADHPARRQAIHRQGRQGRQHDARHHL